MIRSRQAFDIYEGNVSGEIRLPSLGNEKCGFFPIYAMYQSDIIHNPRNLVKQYQKHGTQFWRHKC